MSRYHKDLSKDLKNYFGDRMTKEQIKSLTFYLYVKGWRNRPLNIKYRNSPDHRGTKD